MPHLFGQERRTPDVPLAQPLVADLAAALAAEFLNLTLAGGEAETERGLDEAPREAARRLHGRLFRPGRGGGAASDQSQSIRWPHVTCLPIRRVHRPRSFSLEVTCLLAQLYGFMP